MIVVPTLRSPRTILFHLYGGRPTKLTRAYDQRFVQKPALLEVDDESRKTLITLFRNLSMLHFDVGVAVPRLQVTVPYLNKSYAALDEPSGHE